MELLALFFSLDWGRGKSEKQESCWENGGRRRRRRGVKRKEEERRGKRGQKIHKSKATVDDSKSCEYKSSMLVFGSDQLVDFT